MQLDRVAPRVAAEQPDRAGVGAQQAEQDADGGGLAGAVRAEEAVHLSGGDRQVEPVEGLGGAEGLVQPLNVDDVVHDRRPYPCFIDL